MENGLHIDIFKPAKPPSKVLDTYHFAKLGYLARLAKQLASSRQTTLTLALVVLTCDNATIMRHHLLSSLLSRYENKGLVILLN
ncbi:unnamed protein product [Lupinus luteus]|uniref:Uncharacterized protein n=1 Tax=Lupinus luteus TaxID=3873 RepID=A0AAV1VR68_LUPLU